MKKNKTKIDKKKKKLRKLYFLLFLFVIVEVGLFLVILNTSEKPNNENVEKVNKNELAVKMNAILNFENKVSKNSGIENPYNNNYDIIVEIYLEGSSEAIYKSQKITPGEKIDKVKLQKDIPSGLYKGIAYFNAYDEGNNYKGKSGVEIKLNIK